MVDFMCVIVPNELLDYVVILPHRVRFFFFFNSLGWPHGAFTLS